MSVTTSAGSRLQQELATQPDDWLAARDRASKHADALPRHGERVAVVGCGTSLYMAQAYARLREEAGLGMTDAWTPSEALLDRGYDRLLAITRSGTTTEIIDLLQRRPADLPATVLTATPGTPVLDLATPVLTPEVDEESVVQTRFATSTLALLRWHNGEDLLPAIEQAREVLEGDASALAPVDAVDQITFVGRGWAVGIAQEAALKLRESAQMWTEAYQLMEYRHGPLSIAAPGRAVWVLGDLSADFAADVLATGASLVHADRDPLAELVRVHRLCVVRAQAAGLDPDAPRNLTRAVILHA